MGLVCVCYQVLQSTSSALKHGIEDDRRSSTAVCLSVNEPLKQHEHQRGQLLLRKTLTHHLSGSDMVRQWDSKRAWH